MRVIFLGILFFYTGFIASAQKKSLRYLPPVNWPVISSQKLSNDGKYFTYFLGPEKEITTLIIQSVDGKWRMEVKGVTERYFTEDSRRLVYRMSSDSIGLLELGKSEARYIDKVSSFKLPENGDGKWLAYQLNQPSKQLVLLNLLTGEEVYYENVDDFEFNKNGEILLIETSKIKDSISSRTLQWIELEKRKINVIGQKYLANAFVFNHSNTALAFIAKEAVKGFTVKTLRYYELGMDSAKIIVDSATQGMKGMDISEDDMSFSRKDDKIFFRILKKDNSTLQDRCDTCANVTIWTYKDEILRYERRKKPINAVINLSLLDRVIRLEGLDKEDASKFVVENKNELDDDDDYIIDRCNAIGSSAEYRWRKSASPDIYLVSTRDGARKLLKKRLINSYLEFSPRKKYVIWYDREQKNWFTYRIASGSTKNITKIIREPLYAEEDHPDLPECQGIAGWLENDEGVLIYDQYDIWQVDPDGKEPPINLTRSYGRQHNIQLRYLDFDANDYSFNIDKSLPISKGDTLILSAFNLSNKWNGFFELFLNGRSNLRQLVMEPKTYYFPYPYYLGPDFPSVTGVIFPVKAKNANIYIAQCMSAIEYPNLYLTRDFRNFKALTNLAPQKEYNWYLSELIHWKLFDGRMAEGVLYKPENFDPQKKYPIIFYYYEKSAFALNFFINPALSNGVINIPWFVSNGYLVFVPDIYYKNGYPGQSAYNSVVSAAKYLSQKPWVDAHKMGIQGHSFGGFETNYIVAHTNIFAAAAPSAGSSNLISAYGRFEGDRMQWFYEVRQGRIGTTLWHKPDLYIQNSPIFRADKVTTPLLIMHNKGDHSVLFTQESEWFSALNRLGKRVWLLSYEGEHHTIESGRNQLDYSIRLGQFFDHYLKSLPTPKWMTKGKSPNGIWVGDGLELDDNSSQ